MYIPFVASEACCRNTVSPASFNMSIGIRRRCAAKVVFIIGIYWCARSPETERTRIRLCRPVGDSLASRVVVGFEVDPAFVYERVTLLMYESASVKAPAISVFLVVVMSSSVVLAIKLRSEVRSAFSMSAKGRYLFASERLVGFASPMSTSSEEEEGGG